MRFTGAGDIEGLLATTPTGAWLKVTSWSEFVALPTAVETSPGVWFFDEAIASSGQIDVPTGVRIEGGMNSTILASSWETTEWIFDVDAPAITGPLWMRFVKVTQQNAGASSACIKISGAPGRLVIVSRCYLSGARTAVLIDSYLGIVEVDLCPITECDRGFVIRGSTGIVVGQNNGLFAMNSGALGLEVEASTVLSAASTIVFNALNMALDATQYVCAIDDTISVTAPAVVQFTGGGSAGPQGRFFRQDVGDMSRNDNRLVVTGNAVEPGWRAIAVAARRDQADPLVVIVTQAGVATLIPFSDAALNLAITASTEIRVALVKNAGLTDWYIEYQGPLNGITARISVNGLGKRASSQGPNASLIKWQKNAAPGYPGFVDVEASEADWSSTNSYVPFGGSAISPDTNTGDRFRPVLVNATDTEDQHLGSLSLGWETTL